MMIYRTDAGGATHELAAACRPYGVRCIAGSEDTAGLESMSDGELTSKHAIDAAPFAPTAVVSGASTTVESLSSRRGLDGPTLEPSACAAKSPCNYE